MEVLRPETGTGNMPKLRGFGRGVPVRSTNGTQPGRFGMTHGFGMPSDGNSKDRNDGWNGDVVASKRLDQGFGKPSGGFRGPSTTNDDGRNEDPMPGSKSEGGFGKPSGGFGAPSGGNGATDADDNWDEAPPSKGFRGRSGGTPSGGFGAPSGGNGDADGDWDEAPPSNGFGGRSSRKPSGGFGVPSGGNGTADADHDWNDAPPSNGFGGRSGGGSGGYGAKRVTFGVNGKGGGSGCLKCGEDGHMARECPNGGGDRGGGGRGCHKCGEEGHFARECPNGVGGGTRGGGKGCHKCGEEGHFARECPSGGGGGGGRGRGCHKCGEEGHFARECPNSDTDRGRTRNGGFGRNGGGFGNPSESGHGGFGKPGRGGFGKPAVESGRGGFGRSGGESGRGGFGKPAGESRGRFGQSAGNSSRGGFVPRTSDEDNSVDGYGRGRGGFGSRRGGASRGDGTGGTGCRKCGEEGHFARECPNGDEGGEKPREIYVPPSLDEDSLFKEGVHQGINFDKYDNIDVEVTGNNRVRPIMAFEDAGLMPTFLRNVQRAGYTKPTPIQKHAIPSILAGRDLMGCAQTGSGKTAAFILPVLTSMVQTGLTSSSFSEIQEPQTVVVAPTRELASQIYKEARKFASHTDVRPVVVYGGVSVAHQLKQVENGANLVVGTPGRLLDFIEKGKISVKKVKFLILDEADRMLDMGFEPCIRKLVETMGIPPKTERQTLMFSATFKPEIQKLAADFMNDYLFITVGMVGGACSDVEQMFLEVDRMQKREYLCDILNTSGTNRVLVFVGQKRNADFLASYLSQSGYPSTSIHGDRLQREREEALSDFTRGKSPVLIATNVAARGLDIPDVTHVVNYDLPSDIDEYVHRIGRTGRCGNLGKATSFYSHDTDFALANSLVKILAEARQEVPDWLADYAAAGGSGQGDRFTGHFASKDIRRKKFDSGGDFSNAKNYGGDYGDNSGGSAGTCVADDDDEVWA